MPANKYVFGHLFGTHTHAIAHWFGDIGPSITFEPAFIAILLPDPEAENLHAFRLAVREGPRYENGRCHAP